MKPLFQLNTSQEVLLLSPADDSSYVSDTIVDKALTPWDYTIKAQSKKYHIPREQIHPIQQDIIPRKSTHHPEPQDTLSWATSQCPVPTLKHTPTQKTDTPGHVQSSPYPATISRPSLYHTSQQSPKPLIGTPTATVDHVLSHLADLNDHRPSRHTGTNAVHPAYQNIDDADNTMPFARLTGASEDSISNNSASYTNMMPDNPNQHIQCVTSSPVRAVNPQTSSTLSPPSPSTLSPSTPNSDAESHHSSNSTQSTKQ